MAIQLLDSSLINYCPLGCSHCALGEEVAEKNPGLSFDAIKKIVAKAGQLEVETMRHLMGESFIRDDFVEIMKLVNAEYINCTVTTSGVGLTKKKLEEIYDLPGNNVLTFSLDGDTKELNDGIRFKGSFKKVIDCLEHLRTLRNSGRKSPLGIKLGHTVTNKTYNRMKELHAFLQPYPIDVLEFGVVESSGMNKNGRLSLSTEQLETTKANFHWLNTTFPDQRFALGGPGVKAVGANKKVLESVGEIDEKCRSSPNETKSQVKPKQNVLPCMSLKTIYMDDKGFVYPCRSMVDKEFPFPLGGDSPIWSIKPPNMLDDSIQSSVDLKNSELFSAYQNMIFGNNERHHQAQGKEWNAKESRLTCPLRCCPPSQTTAVSNLISIT